MRLLRRAIRALGADDAQWLTLTRAMLKTDLRSASPFEFGRSQEREGPEIPWLPLLMSGAMGLMITGGAGMVPGLFLSGLFSLSMVTLIVAMVILLDFNSVVISPDDYEILAYQPVSSRTYFVSKLTNVLVYTGIVGVLLGGLTVLPLLIQYGPSPAAAWLVALPGVIMWTSLALIFTYAALLRVVRPERLRRVLSYVQLLLTTVIFAWPLLGPMALDWLAVRDFQPSVAFLLLPPAWFAGILPLASGEWSGVAGSGVLLATGSTAALLLFVGRRLSLTYAERLGALTEVGEASPRRSRSARNGRRIFSAESRVIQTLVRGNFRHDTRFRLGVLGILPTTVIYVFLSLSDGTLPDPFVARGFEAASLLLIHMVVLGGPLMLMQSLRQSDSFRAAWIFFSTPVDRAGIVVRTGYCVLLFFLLPYTVFVAAIFAWAFQDVWHAVGHAAVLGFLSSLVLQVSLLWAPRLPFSEPPRKAQWSGTVFAAMVIFGIFVGLILPPLLLMAYSTTARTLGTLAVLAAANALAPAIVRRAVSPRVERLEFAG